MAFGNIFHDNFKVFLLLIVSILPLASTQVDCNGKGFHCLNTTHFQICVDLGNGISTTVDEFIIPCPPALGCYPDNHFECEFHPIPTVAPVSTKDYFFEETSDATAVFNETVLVNNAPELNKGETELLKNYFDNATDETITNTATTLDFVKKTATRLPDFNITEANNSELLTTLQNNKKDEALKDSIQTTVSVLQTDFTHATTMTHTTTASYDPTIPIKHSNIEIETSKNGTHLSHLLKDLSDLAQSYIILGASHNNSQNTSVSESTTVSYIDKYPSINTESTFSLLNESKTDFPQTIVNEYQMTNSDAVTAVSNKFTLNPLKNVLFDKVLNKTSAVNLNSFDIKSVKATTIQAFDSNNTAANKNLTPTNSDLLTGSNNQSSSNASTSILLNKNETASYTDFPSTVYEVNTGGNVFPLLNDPTTEVPQSAVKQGISVTISDAVTPVSNIFIINPLEIILIDKILNKATTYAVNLDNFATESFETTTMSALGSKKKHDKNLYEGDSVKSLNNQSITNPSTAALPDAKTYNDSISVVNFNTLTTSQKSTSGKPLKSTNTLEILDSTYGMTNVQKTHSIVISSTTHSTIETTIAQTTGTEKMDLFNTENAKINNQAENALKSNKNNTLLEPNYTPESNPLKNIFFDKKPISNKTNKASFTMDSDKFIIAENALKSTDTPDVLDSTYDMTNVQKTHLTDMPSTTHSTIETTMVSVAQTTGTEKTDLFNTENAKINNQAENALKSNKNNTLLEPNYTPESNPLKNIFFDKKPISNKTNKPSFTMDSDKFIIAENALKSTDTPDVLDSNYGMTNVQKTHLTDMPSTTHSTIATTIVSVAQTTGTEKTDLFKTENAKVKNRVESALNSNKNNTLTEPYYTPESNPLENILFDKKPISDKTNKPSITTDSDKFIIAENALQFTDTPDILDSTYGATNVHTSYPSELSMTTLPSIKTTVVSVAQSINRGNTDSFTTENVKLVRDAENTFKFTNTIDILDSTYGTTNMRKTYPADMPLTTTRPIIVTTIVSKIQNINSLPEKTILISSSTKKSITNVYLKNLTPKTKYYETPKTSTLLDSSTLLNTLETTEELYSTTNKPNSNENVANAYLNIENNLNADSIIQVSSDYKDSTMSSMNISRFSLLNTSNARNHATMLPYSKPLEQEIQKATDLSTTESVKNVAQSTDEVTYTISNKKKINTIDERTSNELYENTYNIISTTNNPTRNNDILENYTNTNSYHVTIEAAQTLPKNILFTTQSKSSLLAEELPTKATKSSINEKTSEITTESPMSTIMPNTYDTKLESLSTINSIDLTEIVIESGKAFTDIDGKNENVHKDENERLDAAPDLSHTTRKHIPSEVTTTEAITSNKSHIAIASNLTPVAPEVITDPTASNLPPNTNNNPEISYNDNKLVGKDTITSNLLLEIKENRKSINIKNNVSKSNLDLTQERSDYLITNTTKNTTSPNAIFETITFETITEPTKSTSTTSLKEFEIIKTIEDVISEMNNDKEILSVNKTIASQTQTLRPSNQIITATPGSASQITVQPSTIKAKPNIHKTEDISNPTNAGSLSGTDPSTPISNLSLKGNQGVIYAIDSTNSTAMTKLNVQLKMDNLSLTNHKLGTTSTNYVSLSTASMNFEDIRKNKDASLPKSKVEQKPTGLVLTNAEAHVTYDESMNINVESVNLNGFEEKTSKTPTQNKVQISVKNKILSTPIDTITAKSNTLSNKIVNVTVENVNMPYKETMSSNANKKTAIHLVPIKPYINSANKNNPLDLISPTPSNQQSSSMNIATGKDLTSTLLPITTYLNTAVVNKDEQTHSTISISKTSIPEKSSPINNENSSYQNIISNRNITENTHKNDSIKEVTRPQFICPNVRGKYGDGKDCRVYYICLGPMRKEPLISLCPMNTIFSEIFKQCTKNLSHCVRNNLFQCVSEGRFSDFLKDDVYYICVRNANQHFIRFKLQCEKGWKLNKQFVKCEKSSQEPSTYVSKSERSEIEKSAESSERDEKESEVSKTEKSGKSERDENESEESETEKSEKSDRDEKENKKVFKCKKEGKFADKEDCAQYYVCAKNSKGDLIRKKEKCKKDYIFHKSKKKCVDKDSYECER